MYHIKPNGDAGKCRVTTGQCPFGDTSDHFSSPHDARKAFEAKHFNFKASSLNSVLASEADLHDNAFNAGDHLLEYTPDQVFQKYEADIHGHTFPLSQKFNQGEPGLILEKLFGKAPDSDSKADLGLVELKTLRESSIARPISLGALRLEGDTKKLRKQYLGDNFQHTLKAGDWVKIGSNHYSLLVDRKQRKVRMIIADRNKEFVSTNDFGWSFDSLNKKVDDKLASIAVGLYETEENSAGERAVTFKNMLMGGFSRESLVDKLESGVVNMAFRFDNNYARTTLVARAEDFCSVVATK